jgi:hypothetical protein
MMAQAAAGLALICAGLALFLAPGLRIALDYLAGVALLTLAAILHQAVHWSLRASCGIAAASFGCIWHFPGK